MDGLADRNTVARVLAVRSAGHLEYQDTDVSSLIRWREQARVLLEGIRDTLVERGRITLDEGGRPLLHGISLLLPDVEETP